MNWTGYERDVMNEQMAQGLLSDTPGARGIDALKQYYDYLYNNPNSPEYWRGLPAGSNERMVEFEKQYPMGMRGEIDAYTRIPPGYDPRTGAKILGNDMSYQFPAEQGLLNYGTDPNEASGAVDESGRYNAPYDYPKHAPSTPEHIQMYNLLRFNDLGGGI